MGDVVGRSHVAGRHRCEVVVQHLPRQLGVPLDRFVELTSANAARRFGLYPRKGAIAVGSDADLTLWDPEARRVIDGARMHSRAGYSPYDGWEVRGWPRHVIRRGQTVLADGVPVAHPGQGRWLRRTPG